MEADFVCECNEWNNKAPYCRFFFLYSVNISFQAVGLSVRFYSEENICNQAQT